MQAKPMNPANWWRGGWASLILGILSFVVLAVRPDWGVSPLYGHAGRAAGTLVVCGLVAIATVKITERLESVTADAHRFRGIQKDVTASENNVRSLTGGR